MYSNKIRILLFVGLCFAAAVTASSQPDPEDLVVAEAETYLENYPLIRRVRSPEGGSVVITATKDRQVGREANVQYNHNLYTSRDGRGSIDAYAQASRNFDYNRNNFQGGVQGRWRF